MTECLTYCRLVPRALQSPERKEEAHRAAYECFENLSPLAMHSLGC